MSRSLCPRASVGGIEVAAGQVPFRDALLVDRTSGLAILPSPPRQKPTNSSEFVFSDAMSNMLAQLRQHFDYIIIDAPPLFPLVDARALAEIAGDAALLVDPYDVGAIAAGIRALDADAGLRERMSAAGPATAARFSTEAYRSRLELMYTRLVR